MALSNMREKTAQHAKGEGCLYSLGPIYSRHAESTQIMTGEMVCQECACWLSPATGLGPRSTLSVARKRPCPCKNE